MRLRFALGFEYILIRQFLSQIIIMMIVLFAFGKISQIYYFFGSFFLGFQCPVLQIMIKIQKYLPQEYKVELKLQAFLVGSIKKSETSQALQKIKNIEGLGLDQFSHLKRIRKKNQESDETDLLLCPEDNKFATEKLLETLGEILTKVWSQEVPISNPSTRQQFAEWSKIWPINFIEQEIYKEVKHSKQEIQYLQGIFSKQSKEIIIFNEKQQSLLIKAIDSVCQEGTIKHPIMQILEAWPHTKQFQQLPNAYYLTKLRIFCSASICGMCAMALVHSRLDRIYFPATADIGLISQIMCCSKLNHRIKIFQLYQNP